MELLLPVFRTTSKTRNSKDYRGGISPLEKHYLMVWMDGTVFKVRENPKIINKTVYIALGLRTDGKKEVLRLWLGKTASFVCWMDVLADIKTRGTQDIFVTATDNTDTIKGMLPKAITQICVVHQLINTMRFIVWKDKKAFVNDIKQIFTASIKEVAKAAFEDFKIKWIFQIFVRH
jgi:transposase-like protein